MRKREFYKGYEVVSGNTKREDGKFYLDKPGRYEAQDVHLVLFRREKGQNKLFYLLDLGVIPTLSNAEFLNGVSDGKFRESLEKITGVKSADVYMTKAAKEIIQQYVD